MANKIKIQFKKHSKGYDCFIGDMVYDGLLASGRTKGAAAIAFIKALNKDKQFGVYDKNQTL